MNISAINATTTDPSPGTKPGTTPATSPLDIVNEQTFLKLLVAQLQNQDPLQPQDGMQFVAQLAQFSSLEQQIQMRQDLDSMNAVATKPTSTTPPASQ